MGFGTAQGFAPAQLPDTQWGLAADQDVTVDFTPWAKATTGSGSAGGTLRLLTITGSSGLAQVRRLNYRDGDTAYTADFDKAHLLEFYGCVNAAPGTNNYLTLALGGQAVGVTGFSTNGFGFRINADLTLDGLVADATTVNTQAGLATLVLGTQWRLRVLFTPGVSCEWSLDGALLASSGDNLPSGSVAGRDFIRVNGGHILTTLGTLRVNRVYYRRGW